MLIEYLANAALLYPTHPIVNQELTVDFVKWLAEMNDSLPSGTTMSNIPTLEHLTVLWQWWTLHLKGIHQIPLPITLTPVVPHG